MEEWLEFCESIKKRLNRNLNQEEISLLKWIYEKHRTERRKKLKQS